MQPVAVPLNATHLSYKYNIIYTSLLCTLYVHVHVVAAPLFSIHLHHSFSFVLFFLLVLLIVVVS